MANQIEQVFEGYKSWVGQSVQFSTNQIIAGTTMLLAKSSTAAFGVAVDASGNIFVSDPTEHFIMKIVPRGTVYRYAGLPGTSGNNAGAVVSNYNARFDTPRGLACDAYGNLYVADTGNNQIRKITPDGYTTLVSGSPGTDAGYRNGTNAKFNGPWDLCISKSNDIFVADTGNNCIRKIVNGVKTTGTFTIAGLTTPGDVSGGTGLAARFRSPRAICCAPGGEIYVADAGNYKIKKIWEDGMTRWFSGVGTRGSTVGVAATTQFMDIQGMCVNNTGVIYLVDFDDGIGARLMRVSQIGGTSVVYSFGQQAGSVAVDNSGKLYLIQSPASQGFASSSSSSSSQSSSSSESAGNVSSSSSSQSSLSSSSSSTSSSSSESAGNVSSSSSSSSTSSSSSSSSVDSTSSSSTSSSSTSSNSSSSTSSSSSL